MTDLLRQGAQWLEQRRRAHCSSPVEYIRDGTPATVQATYGKTDYTIANDAGGRIGSHVTDFLIGADELGFTPKVGDVIVADGSSFEVMNFGDDGCWRWSDPYHITMRIHTREV